MEKEISSIKLNSAVVKANRTWRAVRLVLVERGQAFDRLSVLRGTFAVGFLRAVAEPMSTCVSRYPGNVSFVWGRRVLRFAMAEGTWAPTGACEPTLKLTAIEKGCLYLSLPLSLYIYLSFSLQLSPSPFSPSRFSLVGGEPCSPLVCQSAPRFRRESFFFVAASRQLLDGCCWTAFSCQRFTSSRNSSQSVQPSWKVSDEPRQAFDYKSSMIKELLEFNGSCVRHVWSSACRDWRAWNAIVRCGRWWRHQINLLFSFSYIAHIFHKCHSPK